MIVLILIVVTVLYTISQACTVALPRFFLVPPYNWTDKIQQVLDHPTPIYLKVGTKRSSYRKRLISASVQPAFYTNYVNNKLKIHPQDTENANNSFMDAMKQRDTNDIRRRLLYGFFHPYANNGGGGERVLWQAVQSTLLANDSNIAIIYTTNVDAEPLDILTNVEKKFQINGLDQKRIVFIYLRKFNKLIDSGYWKHFTLLGQLLGSILLSLEAMTELSPDIWIDTIGLPGSYFFVSTFLKVPIIAYVHYPILQQDMFNKLKFPSFGFSSLKNFKLSFSDVKQLGKLAYWSTLYYIYVYLGSLVDITLTNGTWTYNHIKSIWSWNEPLNGIVAILYPPCGTEFNTESVHQRDNKLLYIAQFRPEKRHALILEEYAKFLKSFNDAKKPLKSLPTLVFLGSCRDPADTQTLDDLKTQVTELSLDGYVDFIVDCAYSEVLKQLSSAKFGLNAMWNEHFGIGVVEYLANGVIPLVHASAGPLLDIVTNVSEEPTSKWFNDSGFFFKSETDPDYDPSIQDKSSAFLTFANAVAEVPETINYPRLTQLLEALFITEPELVEEAKLQTMRLAGKQLVQNKFSNKRFVGEWMQLTRKAAQLEREYRENKRGSVEQVY